MELLQLRYFLAAAKYQHITKAAESLQIAQPALSQSIKRLEEELGVSLFDRKNRSIQLNEAGKLLEKKLTPLLSSLDHLADDLKEYEQEREHTIHVNLLAAASLVTHCIITYHALHPEVHFQLSQRLITQAGELGIRTLCQDEQLPPDSEIMMEENLYLAVPLHSPLSSLSSVYLEELAQEGWIVPSLSRPLRNVVDRFFMEAGITPRILFENDNPSALYDLISAGLGIGFWPEHSWNGIPIPNIKLIPIEHPSCRIRLVLTHYNRKDESDMVKEFCRFLMEYTQDFT
ncbi:MAG: LysR family transcriptional regulator [bacterium]|nr:LysR family transcriptional regulator [bacterium]